MIMWVNVNTVLVLNIYGKIFSIILYILYRFFIFSLYSIYRMSQTTSEKDTQDIVEHAF